MKKYYENPGILEGCSNLFGTDENMDPKINEKSDFRFL